MAASARPARYSRTASSCVPRRRSTLNLVSLHARSKSCVLNGRLVLQGGFEGGGSIGLLNAPFPPDLPYEADGCGYDSDSDIEDEEMEISFPATTAAPGVFGSWDTFSSAIIPKVPIPSEEPEPSGPLKGPHGVTRGPGLYESVSWGSSGVNCVITRAPNPFDSPRYIESSVPPSPAEAPASVPERDGTPVCHASINIHCSHVFYPVGCSFVQSPHLGSRGASGHQKCQGAGRRRRCERLGATGQHSAHARLRLPYVSVSLRITR